MYNVLLYLYYLLYLLAAPACHDGRGCLEGVAAPHDGAASGS
jgi:hypothetical protein